MSSSKKMNEFFYMNKEGDILKYKKYLRMYISVLINETAFIDGKKHVTFRHYNFMSSSD